MGTEAQTEEPGGRDTSPGKTEKTAEGRSHSSYLLHPHPTTIIIMIPFSHKIPINNTTGFIIQFYTLKVPPYPDKGNT